MGKVLSPGDIDALIHLLGDDDEGVVSHARMALRSAGPSAAPFLEAASAVSGEPVIRDESRLVLEDIHVDGIEREWVALQATEEGVALEEGAFLLERTVHPDRARRTDEAREELRLLAVGAREAVPETAPLDARLDALRDYLHGACGFRGNRENYYDPENSFFSSVISRRTGIPVTLALVYLAMGRRLGLPLCGVGMPMHFLVGVREGRGLRYMDPFHDGREVSRAECLLILERAGLSARAILTASPVVAILERMARNLMFVFQNAGDDEGLRRAGRFVALLTGESS
ncbi:MAG TPA: transglutaminase-like domain-containing protein [Gemmatimonadota bacterium]|nr:transglutaminase-like domain-containing protein [Gemmatimonadota bacterium]